MKKKKDTYWERYYHTRDKLILRAWYKKIQKEKEEKLISVLLNDK